MIIVQLDSHVYIKKDDISLGVLQHLRYIFTLKNPLYEDAQKYKRNTHGMEKYIKCFYEDPVYIILPRGKFRYILSILTKNRIKYKLLDNRRRVHYEFNSFKGNLRPYQKRAIDKINTQSMGILLAPCGSGKTVMAIALISKRKQKTLIIVHTKELLNQWIDRISSFMSIEKKDIGVLGDGVRTIKPITIGMVQTLVNMDLRKVREHFGFVISDECHKIPARTFTHTIENIDPYYILGLSATPYRRDGLDKMIYFGIGDIVHNIEDQELVDAGVRVVPKIIIRNTKYVYPYEVDQNYKRMIQWMIINQDRNRMIIEDIISECKETNLCIVLTDRKAHIQILKDLLDEKGIESYILTGSVADKERKEILKNLDTYVIFATGQLAGEGLDIPELNRLFIVTPISWKGRVKQYIGRILRNCAGKEDAIVYDYVDKNIEVLRRSFYKRQKEVYGEFL